MQDHEKTRAQLIEELRVLRERAEGQPQVEYQEEHESRLRQQQGVLLELALRPELQEAELRPALEVITETAGRCLAVARTGIWVYDENRSLIRCLDLFELATGQHSVGMELRGADYPAYFAALAKERAIAVPDAHTDPRTREFSAAYLTPLGIASMLDAPIRGGGRMLGVVCHEHIGAPRDWSQEEQSFAGSIGDLVALAMASSQRRTDLEERRRLELKVQQAQKLESLGVLAGGIAHDFNNLLVGVLGNAGLALDQLPPGSPARECIQDVEMAARRAAELCQQLLAYSGRGKFVIGALNVTDLVSEMGHLLEVFAARKAVLRYELEDRLPAILADASQVRQVAMNLITNATEALGSAAGSVTIRTGQMYCDRAFLENCHLGEHRPEGDYVYIEVSDTGSGMDRDTLDRIFDPFFTSKFTGRGLGLAAVLGIVRGHAGAIRIHTEPGRGTTFTVLFPRSDEEVLAAVESSSGGEWRGTGTILLVDDDEIVRSVGRRMMKMMGFDVLTANGGAEAVEILRARADSIRCIVLDLTMPEMSGEDAFHALRGIRADVPILLSSGYNEQEAVSGFVGQGLAGFIKKPYVAAQLMEKLREVVSHADSPRRS